MNRAIVLAHFDPDGVIDQYVIDARRRYRQVASRLVMVSASTHEPPAQARSLVDAFVPREKSGFDFGSWRAGIAHRHCGRIRARQVTHSDGVPP